jgi:GntR family transcriptional regulator
MRRPVPDELLIRLEPGTDRPFSRQIVDQVWEQVISGLLSSGQRLPTARGLAIELGLSPAIVERAYRQLEQLGVVSAEPGQGRFVSLSPPGTADRERQAGLERLARETIAEARRQGFTADELVDLLLELRDAGREREPREE